MADPRRFCTRCKTWKPITEFSPKTRHADGSYATVLSRCKACLAELKRIRTREDPEWARAVNKRDWQRTKANPERLARARERTRENGTVYRRRRGIMGKNEPKPDLRQEAQREAWREERAERRLRRRAE